MKDPIRYLYRSIIDRYDHRKRTALDIPLAVSTDFGIIKGDGVVLSGIVSRRKTL